MDSIKNQHCSTIGNALHFGQAAPHYYPFLRVLVTSETWYELIQGLMNGTWTLVGLWGEPGIVHLALVDADGALGIASLPCPDGRFPSVGRRHPPAQPAVHRTGGLAAAEPLARRRRGGR